MFAATTQDVDFEIRVLFLFALLRLLLLRAGNGIIENVFELRHFPGLFVAHDLQHDNVL